MNISAISVRAVDFVIVIAIAVICASHLRVFAGDDTPLEGTLVTRWAKDVTPESVWSEYPRPQLVRGDWQNLNGLWEYAVTPKDAALPANFDGQILVPFAIESTLSGVKRKVTAGERLWYRRTFAPAELAEGQRLLLHFGAVDWQMTAWVNGKQVGRHQGGYDPFYFDVTDALQHGGAEELVVSVWDPTDEGYQPRGKQVAEPRGIWYTSVTGIWQTVWLETVPATYISSIKVTPDIDAGEVHVELQVAGKQAAPWIAASVEAEGRVVQSLSAGERRFTARIPQARLWSPNDPFLYTLKIRLAEADDSKSREERLAAGDSVTSYFAMRKISVGRAADGYNRLMLNNEPLFQFGPLDQGWWPDGLYTAPADAALRYDLEVTKKLGFNMIRKHVKVEPERWYYHCDRLGLLVWQDMPNGDRHIRPAEDDIRRSSESEDNFRREFQALIDAHRNHPCIVAWVPFNEGWGQFETNEIIAWTKQYDPTRIVDGPSGWADRGAGDMLDMHQYPGPGMPQPQQQRAAVLGEFGGLGLPVAGHLWWDKRNWGYRTYTTRQELQSHYEQLIRRLRPLIGSGLAAAVYTQTTDVDGEVNGLMTYDRALIKLDSDRTAALHAKLYLPPPLLVRKTLIPTSEESAQQWRFTTDEPQENWQQPDFDDSAWRSGPGGFGEAQTPGAVVRTPWKSADIWLRRSFPLRGTELHALYVRIHHDEDVEIYLNGRPAAALSGYTTSYQEFELAEEATKALHDGTNTIAVHCRQTGGGQYIDVGLLDVEEKTDTPPARGSR